MSNDPTERRGALVPAPEQRMTLSLDQLTAIAQRWEADGVATPRELMFFYWCIEKSDAYDKLVAMREADVRDRAELRALVDARDDETKRRLIALEKSDQTRSLQMSEMHDRINVIAASLDATFEEVSRVGDKAKQTSEHLRALAARLQSDRES